MSEVRLPQHCIFQDGAGEVPPDQIASQQVRAGQVCLAEVDRTIDVARRVNPVRVAEVCADQSGGDELGSAETRIRQHRLAQIRALEIRAEQVRALQVRRSQIEPPQVQTTEAGARELELPAALDPFDDLLTRYDVFTGSQRSETVGVAAGNDPP